MHLKNEVQIKFLTFFFKYRNPTYVVPDIKLKKDVLKIEKRGFFLRIKRVAFIGTPKKLFGHQQNLAISVNLIFNPNHKTLPKFSESNIQIWWYFKLNE